MKLRKPKEVYAVLCRMNFTYVKKSFLLFARTDSADADLRDSKVGSNVLQGSPVCDSRIELFQFFIALFG